jgi:putative ABC transport system ATP-binding protein
LSLLEVSDLTIEYSSAGYVVRPVRDFSLEMRAGELGLILGPSGCGKSTLLSALAGLLRPASGSIRVNGCEVTGLRGAALGRYRQSSIGIVFQAFNLIPSLTARENIELVLRTAGQRRSASRARAEALLGQVDLAEHVHQRPGKLSGGQQQRVAIARALALDPPLLLADEPTAHLDYIQVEGVLRILRELAEADRTVLIATHDERLLPLADRVIELVPHHLPTTGPAETLELEDEALLFRQGDPGTLVYMVESGTVVLTRELSDGTEERIQEAGPGAYFGEFAPMFGLPRSATARARGRTVVTGLPLSVFRSRMRAGARNEGRLG